MIRPMRVTDWALVLVLGSIWGGSYVFNHIALVDLPPFTLVFARLSIAAAALVVAVRLTGGRMPTDLRAWGIFLLLGAINNAVPMTMIVIGQVRVATGLASILAGPPDDNFDHAALDFIGGGNLWVFSDRRPIAAASMNTFGKAPAWGSAWKAFIKENADRANTSYLQKTTLPYEDNYLDLDPVVKDPLGLPVCRITADYKDNERRIATFIQDKMEAWYRAAGAIEIQRGVLGVMGPTTHAYGGTRMGDNADTNVVDRWGFSHEAPNLGVLGASVMGTSGARNPTLTAQALAWRTAEHLVKNWKTIAG